MIDRLVRRKTSLPPVEVNLLVRANQSRCALQFLIAEIFSLQAALSIRRSDELGVFEYFSERRKVDCV